MKWTFFLQKLRQSRLTEHFKEPLEHAHPQEQNMSKKKKKKKKEISEWVERCRALRAQARKYTIIDLLKLS